MPNTNALPKDATRIEETITSDLNISLPSNIAIIQNNATLLKTFGGVSHEEADRLVDANLDLDVLDMSKLEGVELVREPK